MHDFDTSNLTHLSNDIFEECHDDMNWKNLEWDWSILHPMKFALFGLLFLFYFFKEPHIWNFTNSIFSNNLYWGVGGQLYIQKDVTGTKCIVVKSSNTVVSHP